MESPWYTAFFGHDYARFEEHPTTAREVRFLDTVLRPCRDEGAYLLDLACGMGRHAVALSRKGYRVIGLDLSDVMLGHARKRKSSVRWVRGDMAGVPLESGSCGAVISMFSSIGYFNDESENYHVLSEIARVLRPGGKLVIKTANRDFFMKHAPRQSWFTKGGLTVLEERRFDLVVSRSEVDVTVLEGPQRRAYHHSIRLYTATELAMLLASLDIDTLDVRGDFGGAPLTVDAPHLILIVERT